MAKAHLIFGPTGAGKTTYGRGLAEDHSAALFVIDEWMATLFSPDAPATPSLEWALPRVERCEKQIWAVAKQLLALGTDVALELGFFTRAQRDRVRALAAADRFMIRTHVLEAPLEVRRERVRKRNAGGANYSVEVDDATFDWAEKYYEPLGEDELRGATVVKTA
jgi:predicted kinase